MSFGRLISWCCNKPFGMCVLLLYAALVLYSIMATDYFGILVAVIFGGLSIYIACRMEGLIHGMNTLIHEMRRSQIDEKIAVIYRTASEVRSWEKLGIDPDLTTDKVIRDIRAAIRVKDSAVYLQYEDLASAVGILIEVMKKEQFTLQAHRLEELMPKGA